MFQRYLEIRKISKTEKQHLSLVLTKEKQLQRKLLQLRECLQGKALKVVEHLRHSPTAYEILTFPLNTNMVENRQRALTLKMEELHALKAVIMKVKLRY